MLMTSAIGVWFVGFFFFLFLRSENPRGNFEGLRNWKMKETKRACETARVRGDWVSLHRKSACLRVN
jgi:hypothetical protein